MTNIGLTNCLRLVLVLIFALRADKGFDAQNKRRPNFLVETASQALSAN